MLAESIVRTDIIRRGYVPSADFRDTPHDIVVQLGLEDFQTIQVKVLIGSKFLTTNRAKKKGEKVSKNGKDREVYNYKDRKIRWMAAVNTKTDQIFYYKIGTYSPFKAIDVRRVPPDTFPFRVVPSNRTPTVHPAIEESCLPL